jgi:cholest-4-en-3-one 26-monooxygenase
MHTSTLATEIDLTDMDQFVVDEPYELYDELRAHSPIWRHPETAHEESFWAITSHALITQAHRMGPVLSHQTGPGRDGAGGVMLPDIPVGPGMLMILTDPPAHTRYRKLVSRDFTPRMVQKLEDSLRIRSHRIIDALNGRTEGDFVIDLASELPLMAIAEIIGVPQEDRHKLFEWTNSAIGRFDPEFEDDEATPDEPLGSRVEAFNMADYAQLLIDEKRRNPSDDLWTRLLETKVTMADGTVTELDDLELTMFFSLLVIAGNETTRNAITHGLLAFHQFPDQWELLRRKPELLPSAVDEILRFASPVRYFRRTAGEDIELGGAHIRAGEKVTLWYPAGNRDPEVFDDPHRFDITRSPNPHLAFGGGGAHYCLGANLAKLELEVMFKAMADRLPEIEVIGPPERLRDLTINGIKHLPVRYRPRASAEAA